MGRAGSELRRRRLDAGLTQARVARRAGIPASVLSAYETGTRQPGADAYLDLLDVIAELRAERRVARQLEQVLALADALPHRGRDRPPLPANPFRATRP